MEEELKSRVRYEVEETPEGREGSVEIIKVQKVKYDLDVASQASAPDAASIHLDFWIQKVEEFLDGLTRKQIRDEIHEIMLEHHRFNLENDIFEEFLQANDPSLLQGLPAYLELHSKNPFIQISSCSSAISLSNAYESMSTGTLSGRPGRGPRINLNLRTDILLRSVEDMHISLEKFITRSHETKSLLKAEQEETRINHAEVDEAAALFQDDVVVAGTDPITGRIPAEKYIRYMNDWMKSAQFTVDKMRLRFATSKAKYQRLCTLLELKKEQGEGVHAVDFEKLTIENQRLLKKIEQKNIHLVELKRMTGQANYVLTDHRNFLQQQLEELAKLNKKIKKIMKKTDALDKEYDKSMAQMEHEQIHLARLKKMMATYRVPSVLSYARLKAEMSNLEKQLKVWTRKLGFQQIALQTQRAKLSKCIGSKYSKELYQMIKRKGDASIINEWLFNLPSEGKNKGHISQTSVDSLEADSIQSDHSGEEGENKTDE